MGERFAIVPCWAFKEQSLSGNDWRVYLTLRMFAGIKGEAWPKLKHIQELTGLHRCHIANSTTKLVRLGLIEKTGNGGRGRPATYRIIERLETLPESATFRSETLPDSVTFNALNVTGFGNPSEKTNKEKDHMTALFLFFWNAYPIKKAKVQAFRSWKALKPDEALMQDIMRGLEAAKLNGWKDPAFIPHAATWLNDRRWEDEHVQTVKPERRVAL